VSCEIVLLISVDQRQNMDLVFKSNWQCSRPIEKKKSLIEVDYRQ
jgi:hypothetical protein